jgi:cellulose biosynthesis protein BcsQ
MCFAYLILNSYFAPVQCEPSDEVSKLVKKVTSVVESKDNFIVEGYQIINFPLQLNSSESTLDSLKYRLGNLKYSSNFERVKPEIVLGYNKKTDY